MTAAALKTTWQCTTVRQKTRLSSIRTAHPTPQHLPRPVHPSWLSSNLTPLSTMAAFLSAGPLPICVSLILTVVRVVNEVSQRPHHSEFSSAETLEHWFSKALANLTSFATSLGLQISGSAGSKDGLAAHHHEVVAVRYLFAIHRFAINKK